MRMHPKFGSFAVWIYGKVIAALSDALIVSLMSMIAQKVFTTH